MKIRIHNRLSEINRSDWNALVVDDHPFLRYEFLSALEDHNCVGEAFGWLSHHITIYRDGSLLAAMPLYLKTNSYGEFVFDHAWADAYQRHGFQYYPKLVSAIPYTPVTGQRFLARKGEEALVYPLLVETAMKLAQELGVSGLHWLFPSSEQQNYLESDGRFFERHDCQFHWSNENYDNFEQFLGELRPKRRKNIRQERRRVARSGIQVQCLDGGQATDRDWYWFNRFYHHTFETKWGTPTLNEEFFSEVGGGLPNNVLLVTAKWGKESDPVAGALMYRSKANLFGRFWGALEHVDALHFEACYYQGIEYCIDEGLRTFEPGAQGEHKIARGFTPVLTRSSHWLAQTPLSDPILRFCEHEKQGVAEYMEQLPRPFK
ncbi:MAG: GNAT family N-acetyltransferase [bacterium]